VRYDKPNGTGQVLVTIAVVVALVTAHRLDMIRRDLTRLEQLKKT